MDRSDKMKRATITVIFVFCLVAAIAILINTSSAHAQRQDHIYIDTPDAYILSGPGTEYRILGKINRSDPLIVLYWKGDWFQVEKEDGAVGWINRVVLSKSDSDEYPVYVADPPRNDTNTSKKESDGNFLDKLKHGFKGSGDNSITASAGGRGIDESDNSGSFFEDFESVGFIESIIITDYEIKDFINAGDLKK